ncbi:hypothetical protein N7493_004032 [Penicillium malachiteum]|uniref:Uncharacterized protein n=1 Tax=Penicillium malachiteum TaxID=1324776 RepID=A0AAD6HRE6_9EURO|nr:hypothetical protein N7493_004032 [Penicillium malachiteum]
MSEYRLAIELTAQVISYLIDSGSDPAPYATVNREWQMLIEHRTFKTITLNTKLEPYSIEARAELETAEEQRRNNEIFVAAIQSLFNIFKSWSENEPGIDLSIGAESVSDFVDRQRSRQARRAPENDLRQRSPALRDFSQQLTFMRLQDIVVGKELFWPINSTDDLSLPSWPNLTYVDLQYGITTPSGEWLFERDPEEDEFDPNFDREEQLPEHKKRAPEDRVLNAFRMKASPGLLNGFTSEAHANLLFVYKVDGTTAKATWSSRKLFTPDEPVLQAWRDAGFRHTGVESEIQLEAWENPV